MNQILDSNSNISRSPVTQEPRFEYRYIVKFPTDLHIPNWCFQLITKPQFKNGEWSDIEINILDFIGPKSPSKIIYEFIEKTTKEKLVFTPLPKYKKITNSSFNFTITDLDPTGIEIGEWLIEVNNIVSVDYGTCRYNSKDIQFLTVILKVKDCHHRD